MFRACYAIVSSILISFPAQVDGKDYSYPDANCRCTAPDNWIALDRSGYVLMVASTDRTKGFFVKIYPVDLADRPADSYEGILQRHLSGNGYTLVDKTWVKLDGVDFYQVDTTKIVDGKIQYGSSFFAAVPGKVYLLFTSEMNSKPTDDPEIKALLGSFTFLSPPRATPRDPAPPTKSGEMD